MNVRLKFNKYGIMKFIGHLDIMRYFQKAFKRADIDIAYSQGYNPHQLMSFAAPLGVGVTSDSEYLDIKVNTLYEKENFIKKVNCEMAEGIEIIDFKILDDKIKKSMSIVNAADYIVYIKEGYFDSNFFDIFSEFMKQNEIIILKKSKKTEKEVDIKPFIMDYSINHDIDENSVLKKDELAQEYINNNVYLQLATGSVNNLKPDLVMEAYCNFKGVVFDKFAFALHRLEVFDEEMQTLIK